MSKGFEEVLTPGPWIVSMTPTRVGTPDGEISISWRSNVDESVELRAETACRVIAEAGTVLHETGLTPRQLAEQRAELLEGFRQVAFSIEQARKPGNDWKRELELIQNIAETAIANAPTQRKETGA